MVYLDKEIEALTPPELEKYYKDAVEAAKKRKPLGAKPEAPSAGKPDAKHSDAGKEEAGAKGDDAKEEGKADGGDGKEKPADKPAPRPATPPRPLDLEDAYLRLKRLTTMPGSEGNLEITPGGDRIIFSGSEEGGGLFSVKWDGTDRKKLGPAASVQEMTLTGDRIVAVAGGRPTTLAPAGGEQKFLDIESTIAIDRQGFADRRFRELARTLGEQFYHPTMKGLDWPALTQRYLALARATRTPDEFNFVANRFVGELDASHLGVTAPEASAPIRQPQGRIGGVVRQTDAGALIETVYANSPAARATPPLRAGDVITAVEFEPFARGQTLDERLRGRIGKETALTVRRQRDDRPSATAAEPGATPPGEPAAADRSPAGPAADFTVLLSPISSEAQRRLAYEDWLRRTREQVAQWSDGRIGYIHIESMNQPELDQFERDLFAAAEGKRALVIDVRNNGGGWTADRLLSSIMVQPHAYARPRGMDPSIVDGYPQDRLFIQRYAQPMNMLCNEKSFSNAEITAHAFKTLKRGTLVGQQTYGGVISTGSFSLLDGTVVRLPFRGWYLPDGTDMERHGATPDIIVIQTPEAESANDDEQLKRAVEDLLRRLS
ncbi:MAG: S41 family peptidase [Phycisphaerales bacterium]